MCFDVFKRHRFYSVVLCPYQIFSLGNTEKGVGLFSPPAIRFICIIVRQTVSHKGAENRSGQRKLDPFSDTVAFCALDPAVQKLSVKRAFGFIRRRFFIGDFKASVEKRGSADISDKVLLFAVLHKSPSHFLSKHIPGEFKIFVCGRFVISRAQDDAVVIRIAAEPEKTLSLKLCDGIVHRNFVIGQQNEVFYVSRPRTAGRNVVNAFVNRSAVAAFVGIRCVGNVDDGG